MIYKQVFLAHFDKAAGIECFTRFGQICLFSENVSLSDFGILRLLLGKQKLKCQNVKVDYRNH